MGQHWTAAIEALEAAPTGTWRIDRPAMADAPLVGVLQPEIARHVEAYGRGHGGASHPWLKTCPSLCYHCTCQRGTSERRICLAFDVWPD